MRRLECFHALRGPDGAWVVLRLDGRGFTRFTAERCAKPFDPRFHEWMVATARAVLEDFAGATGRSATRGSTPAPRRSSSPA